MHLLLWNISVFFPLKTRFCLRKESYFYLQKSAIYLVTIRDASMDLSWHSSHMKVSKILAVKCSTRKQLSKFHLMMENNLSCQNFPYMPNRIWVKKVYFLLNSRTTALGMQGVFTFCHVENLYSNTSTVNVTVCYAYLFAKCNIISLLIFVCWWFHGFFY